MLYDIALKRKNYKEAFRLTSSMTDNCIANERKARAVAASASDCGTSALERSLVYCLALDYADKSCGKVGVNGGHFDKKLKFGVNCYGYKPNPNKSRINYYELLIIFS